MIYPEQRCRLDHPRPPQVGAGSWHSRPRPTPARPHRRHRV